MDDAVPPAPSLDWDGETPVSQRFGDPYYSRADGLAEARHVYLAGCGLPERYRDGLVIAELGTGTGLNLAAAWAAWQAAGVPGTLHYTGFEAEPPAPGDAARALAAFPSLGAAAEPALCLAGATGARRRVLLPGLAATLIVGDARETLPLWDGAADAWFLDGFAPARAPGLWEPALLEAVAARTAPGGRLASFTAAGHVRRALAQAGLVVERRPGFGAKRHMTAARRP